MHRIIPYKRYPSLFIFFSRGMLVPKNMFWGRAAVMFSSLAFCSRGLECSASSCLVRGVFVFRHLESEN